ncbi:hypothetical protein [Streptomyces sp. NPDC047046]|uniref:hypothetical protein n=1 Tax=Streptomyces sp. NPDC047046 TaxID=3155378 RepID=UPI0033CB1ED5
MTTPRRFVDALLDDAPAAPAPRLCVWCHELTTAPVPVRYVQTGSGPGVTQYACPAHVMLCGVGPMPGELDD